jgi:AcrR family transcriptional regulator
MPTGLAAGRSAQRTRQRILEAAILRFSENSYESTTLRDIAVDVGVDVALVHRSFGSKEDLFRAAVRGAFRGGFLDGVGSADLGGAIADALFRPRVDAALRPIDPLDIVTHSLSSVQASPILREFVMGDYIAPLAMRLGGAAQQRAALAIACLTGIVILRDVLRIEPLMDQPRQELQPLIEKIMRACLVEDEGSAVPLDDGRPGIVVPAS